MITGYGGDLRQHRSWKRYAIISQVNEEMIPMRLMKMASGKLRSADQKYTYKLLYHRGKTTTVWKVMINLFSVTVHVAT